MLHKNASALLSVMYVLVPFGLAAIPRNLTTQCVGRSLLQTSSVLKSQKKHVFVDEEIGHSAGTRSQRHKISQFPIPNWNGQFPIPIDGSQFQNPIDSIGNQINHYGDHINDYLATTSANIDVMKNYQESTMAEHWQIIMPMLWMLALGLLPLGHRIVDGATITLTEKYLAVVMWATMFGGYFLFTNIILFKSSLWEGVRPLSGIEAMYFMAVCITTVGYGDIAPITNRGKIFVGMYIVGSLFVVSLIISDAVGRVYTRLKAFEDAVVSYDEMVWGHLDGVVGAFKKNVSPPSFKPVLDALLQLSFFFVTWAIFFHYMPKEEKTWTDAVYNALISLGTIGFGDISPDTEAGMAFAAWWLILGAGCLANVITMFSRWVNELRICDELHVQFATEDLAPGAIEKFNKLSENQQVSEAQFVLACLWNRHLIGEEDIKELKAAWAGLCPHEGYVPLEVIEGTLNLEIEQRRMAAIKKLLPTITKEGLEEQMAKPVSRQGSKYFSEGPPASALSSEA